jgi:hypothetical protein
MRRVLAILTLIMLLFVLAHPALTLPRTDLSPKDAADAALCIVIAAALFLFDIGVLGIPRTPMPEPPVEQWATPSLQKLAVLIC